MGTHAVQPIVLRSLSDWYDTICREACPYEGSGWVGKRREHMKYCRDRFERPVEYPCLCTFFKHPVEEVGVGYEYILLYEYRSQLQAKLDLLA